MAAGVGRRLAACLLNISEARSKEVVERVARAAVYEKQGGRREGITVLNIFSDHDYNRSVITIVATIDQIAVAVSLTERVPGTSVFHFGFADTPQQRSLVQRRKELGWFRKNPDLRAMQSDVGAMPGKRYGLTGVGASPYVMNCNVTISTSAVGVGRQVAEALRGSSPGGVPGLQVMALPHEGAVEIACNVESLLRPPEGQEGWPSYWIQGRPYCYPPASLITARVAELAMQHRVGTLGTALVGFTPEECRRLAEHALAQGVGEYWREQRKVHM
nr:PREDICTED: uncharacterized protein LOC102694103 isoform X2 [Lepisosteus oculatus]